MICTHVLDPQAHSTAMEDVLHWACKSEKENEVLVELLLPKLIEKWDILYCLPNKSMCALSNFYAFDR